MSELRKRPLEPQPLTAEQVRDEWLAQLDEEGKRERTLIGYRDDLKFWFRWCDAAGVDPLAVDRTHARAYGADMKREGKSRQTLQRRLGTMRRWYAWMADEELTDRNLLQGFKIPKGGHRKLPRVMTREQVQKVIASQPETSPLRIRDKAIMATLYGSGLRVSELIALDVQDVDLDLRQIHVADGKGGKPRLAPLTREAAEVLRLYLEAARPKLAKSQTSALWLTGWGGRGGAANNGKRVSRQLIQRLCQRAGKTAGVEGVHAHAFRHSFATHVYEGGGDLLAVKEALGHASLETTQVYLHTTTEHVGRAVDRAFEELDREHGVRAIA